MTLKYELSAQMKKNIEETVGIPFDEIATLDDEDIDRICIEKHGHPRQMPAPEKELKMYRICDSHLWD